MPEVKCNMNDCYFNESGVCSKAKIEIVPVYYEEKIAVCINYEREYEETPLDMDCQEYHRRVDEELEGLK
jgi:hypothetical protein